MKRWLPAFVCYFYLCYPTPALALWDTKSIETPKLRVGSHIVGQALACFKKKDLERVVDHSKNLRQAFRYFMYPYSCSVTEVRIFIIELVRKFKDQDGTYFWIVGVGQYEGPPQFYITVPAERLYRAP